MHGKGMEWWGAYEPFHIVLNNYGIADIVLTQHAKSRYADRVAEANNGNGDVTAWIWQCLKQNRVRPYSHSEYNAYLIDDDTVIVVDFRQLEGVTTLSGEPLYVMVVVSFLGRISATPQLRDLKKYYSWLRHSRRMKLMKKRRRRK
ncbi:MULTISPECIES: hypothetical protein [unclassified Paenibacillus]|uniref:hypothetical protein n=1 Tax=unclassified Paenibacillus TaxID=185978 RepID=UPI00096F90C4|nr:hypothetical protein [Paenibacillus sp. FSL H8-0259]OMF25974.1 hypothetical protein BK132_20480 [Paenibacillus sp. FSL H8-0259]